jgi:hypothetical protein
MIRAVARITMSCGTRCRARHHPPRPAGDMEKLRTALRDQLDPQQLDGIISMHLIESDPALSRPITDDPSAPNPGAGDWFVLIDATDVNAIPAAAARIAGNAAYQPLVITSGVYNLMWTSRKATFSAARHMHRDITI